MTLAIRASTVPRVQSRLGLPNTLGLAPAVLPDAWRIALVAEADLESRVPGPAAFRFQPDENEVAGRLVELTLGTPAEPLTDIGGHGWTGWPIWSAATYAHAASTRKIVPVLDPRHGRPRSRPGAKIWLQTRLWSPEMGGFPGRAGGSLLVADPSWHSAEKFKSPSAEQG
jgi:hypothetical protein